MCKIKKGGGFHLFVFFLLINLPGSVLAEGLDWYGQVSYRLNFNYGLKRFTEIENIPLLENSLYLSCGNRWMPFSWLGFGLGFNSNKLSLQTIKSGDTWRYFKETLLMDEAYCEMLPGKTKWFRLRIGKEYFSTGHDLVFSDYQTGVSGNMDFQMISDVPLIIRTRFNSFTYGKLLPFSQKSYLTLLELAVPLSFFEEIALFGCYHYDRANTIAAMAQAWWFKEQEAKLERISENDFDLENLFSMWQKGIPKFKSKSDLFWTGLRANKITPWNLDFDAFFSVNLGNVRLIQMDTSSNTVEMDTRFSVLGFSFDLDIGFCPTNTWTAELFITGVSGDPNILSHVTKGQTVSSFLSLIPRLESPEIFFNSGLNAGLNTRKISLVGSQAMGLWALGLGWQRTLFEIWRLQTTTAHLTTFNLNKFYGFEQDISLQFTKFSSFQPIFKAGLFIPMEFYQNKRIVLLLSLGLDYFF
jgi:hypothetical protein